MSPSNEAVQIICVGNSGARVRFLSVSLDTARGRTRRGTLSSLEDAARRSESERSMRRRSRTAAGPAMSMIDVTAHTLTLIPHVTDERCGRSQLTRTGNRNANTERETTDRSGTDKLRAP